MDRISIVSGSLRPVTPLSADQRLSLAKAVWDQVIPGVDFDIMADTGTFRINQSLAANEDKVNANNFQFVTKLARLTKDLTKLGISLKGELIVITESRTGNPALQHISVLAEHVVHTAGVTSWHGKSTVVHI